MFGIKCYLQLIFDALENILLNVLMIIDIRQIILDKLISNCSVGW